MPSDEIGDNSKLGEKRSVPGDAKKVLDKENDSSKNGDGPLRSQRDPRRTPLLSRIPFTPTPSNPKPAGEGRGVSSSARGRKKDITPAYAYKNAETGLLEIRTVIPPSLDIVANEDETVVGLDADSIATNTKLALYPIALNGGGAGLYRDPREFANGNVAGFSTNHRTASSRRAPLKSHVRFAWPYENKINATAFLRNNNNVAAGDRDIETGLRYSPSTDDDDRTTRTRQSLGSLASAMNPWKIWENVHIEMSRLAALRTQRLEDDATHVTLARQRNKAARVSSVYNDDDFDFALVLAPHEAYAFWACHLDFREEALHLVEDEGSPHIEELDGGGDGQQDDASTIATETAASQTMPANSTPKSPTEGSGLRRRRKTPTSGSNNRMTKKTPSSTGRFTPNRSPYRNRPRMSERVFCQRKSLFDRALDKFSPPGFSQRNLSSSATNKSNIDLADDDDLFSPASEKKLMSPSPQRRRRWGNAYDSNKISSPHLTTPPIVSLRQQGSSVQKRRQGSSNIFTWKSNNPGSGSARKKRLRDDDDRDANDKDSEDQFFSSPGIPRGIGK